VGKIDVIAGLVLITEPNVVGRKIPVLNDVIGNISIVVLAKNT